MTLSMTRTIINRAIRMQPVTYDVHPFTYWKRPADPEQEIDMSVKNNRPIFNYLKIMRKHADVAFRMILDNLAGIQVTTNKD